MRRILAIVSVAALMVMLVATPALAQPRQNGLVNVNISGNNVQVPISVAANICNFDVSVLAQQRNAGTLQDPVCTAGPTAAAQVPPGLLP